MLRRMRATWIAAAAGMLAIACGRATERPATTARLEDVVGSVARAREIFNAHKGEARFVALLSPT